MAAQDMPPPGGFSKIHIERTFPKPLMRQSIFFFTLISMSLVGMTYLREWKKRHRTLRIELQEHFIAMAPFLFAERDRKYLKRLKEIREFETFVMKDTPGWVTGTFFGEKIYKTVPDNMLELVHIGDYTFGRPPAEWGDKSVTPDFHK